jgi:hypothetical protein
VKSRVSLASYWLELGQADLQKAVPRDLKNGGARQDANGQKRLDAALSGLKQGFGVLAASNGEAITSVRYENANGRSKTITANLVVDASGRGAPTLGLLRSIGRPPPEETTIGIDVGYATCIFSILDVADRGQPKDGDHWWTPW